MNKEDKTEIISRYNERLDKFGPAIEALAVGSEERRNIRYKVLTGIGDLRGKRILDLGCGFGDLWGYLKNAGVECDYTGFDINARLIEIAKEKYPKANFRLIDILEEPFETFDYIISSNAFNNKLRYEDNYTFIEKILRVACEHATKGVAVDFLTLYVDFRRDYGFYYEPERVFSIAKKNARRVCLRHDYPLFEFCIYLYKND